MPTPLPHSSLRCLRDCSTLRAFISTRKLSGSPNLSQIRPESPNFIEIPRPPQQEARVRPRIRGVLPVPRKIFPKHAPIKTPVSSPTIYDRLQNPVPEPTSPHKLREHADPRVAYKQRLAALRREHLRTGLKRLLSRKIKYDTTVAKRSADKQADRKERTEAALNRDDDRLTAPTITEALRNLRIGLQPDPNKEERIAASKQNMKALQQAREERRRDALHTLYMSARDFITTEAELNQQIEELFVEYPFTMGDGVSKSKSIWEAYGPPTAMNDMLRSVNNSQKTALAYHSRPAVVTGKRMVRLAEELTGGKMD